ncbi:MAG: tRNA pseudouridine synthase A [Suipraeoptans sp.]
MENIKLKIEYDGSRYQGFEKQKDSAPGSTISGKLIEVIKRMTGEDDIELICALRTEVGVHAYGQVANFKTYSNIDPEDVKHYMNRYLPMDIAIVEATREDDRFQAKLNAISKSYIYHIFIDKEPNVFDRKHSNYTPGPIDRDKIRAAADLLTGIHDFKNFSGNKSNKSTTKEVLDINAYGDEGEMYITISANDFLHNMARIIIATLTDIGLGNRPVDDITAIFNGDKAASGPCDPKGLFLQDIVY